MVKYLIATSDYRSVSAIDNYLIVIPDFRSVYYLIAALDYRPVSAIIDYLKATSD